MRVGQSCAYDTLQTDDNPVDITNLFTDNAPWSSQSEMPMGYYGKSDQYSPNFFSPWYTVLAFAVGSGANEEDVGMLEGKRMAAMTTKAARRVEETGSLVERKEGTGLLGHWPRATTRV